MKTSEIVSIVQSALFTFGVVGVVFILAVFTNTHWGWILFIAFIAIAVLENAYMRNIGGGAK